MPEHILPRIRLLPVSTVVTRCYAMTSRFATTLRIFRVLRRSHCDRKPSLVRDPQISICLCGCSFISGFQERLDSSGAPSMILPETAAEYAFNQAHNGNPCQVQPCGARWALWPASMVVDTTNDQALVFYMLVSGLPGNFNLRGVGNSVAIWQNFSQQAQRPSFNPPVVPDHPDLMFAGNEPNFGTASLMVKGALYVYGCGMPTNSSDKECRLAKVDRANVLNRNAWAFYAGSGNWSSQLSDAVSVIPDANILSVSWNDYLQQYVAIYSQTVFDQRHGSNGAQSGRTMVRRKNRVYGHAANVREHLRCALAS